PLLFGGKVYNSLKVLISVKVFLVLGFLILVALLYSTRETWAEILTGFVKFGSVPVVGGGESDMPLTKNIFVSLWRGEGFPHIDSQMLAILGALAAISGSGGL